MNFNQAVITAFSKYAVFTGRASRPEFWWFALFNTMVAIAATIVDNSIGIELFSIMAGLALLLPGLGVAVRRLHDTDRTGWWVLIGLTIVGLVVLIIFYATPGTPGDNEYGPAPAA
jgi:uncharacterized membrane protein YhaH (DUF805 family)